MANLKFVGPGGGDPALTLDYYTAAGNKRFKDALGLRLYDTLRFKAGNAVPTGTLLLFTIPRGSETQVVNAPTEKYIKGLIDTNMDQSGSLSKGREFIVHSIQAEIVLSGATATTYSSTGNNVELATDPTPSGTAGNSATNFINHLLRSGYLRFIVGEKEYEVGKLIHFPSPYGISGFAGGGSTNNFESIAQNGFGRGYRLPVPRHIDGLRNFRVEVEFENPITVIQNFTLTVTLEGLLLRPVQ